jgi:hypothetical protein
MVASIIKAVQTRVLAHADDDPTTATINLDRWLYIETYLVIITASIPCLKSLLRPFGRQTTSTGRSTYELGSPFTGSSGPRSRRLTPTAPGKGIMRISDGNASADDILEWDATDSDRVDEPAASKKSIHVYV